MPCLARTGSRPDAGTGNVRQILAASSTRQCRISIFIALIIPNLKKLAKSAIALGFDYGSRKPPYLPNPPRLVVGLSPSFLPGIKLTNLFLMILSLIILSFHAQKVL
jgi:hypothetical protein